MVIDFLYSQHGQDDYTEPHGKVKGTVFNKMTYHGYFSKKAVTSDDMKESIIFIPMIIIILVNLCKELFINVFHSCLDVLPFGVL